MGLSRRSLLIGTAVAAGGTLLGGTGAAAGTGPYLPTPDSLRKHPLPGWYPRAKFGVFVHWGPYAVPAWGDDSWSSEWYLYGMNATAKGGLHEHHRRTYGEDFGYDDFIPRFTAERYDPDDWVRLFERAGAGYFVLTSKHHDGFQLFPNSASDRHSVRFGPHRDLVGELFLAARRTRLKRGLYYSLGEFYNPALGTAPRNPYTGAPVPYTGYRPVTDYVAEYEHVHLRTLIDRYDPDILWGDGHGSHDFGAGHIFRPPVWDWRSDEILAHYYNRAEQRHKGVLVNDRFIASHADIDSVEGDKLGYVLRPEPWEACLTMSRSWGYMDPTYQIKSPQLLVRLLVDIVAKNGNLLLNIGPRADGTIPDWQRDRLLAIGRWLEVNGRAVFGSVPWRRAEDGELRYTVTGRTFNIIGNTWPGEELTVPADLPIADGARVHLLDGHGGDGRPLRWRRAGDTIVITLPARQPPLTAAGFPTVFTATG
ncbi:alpha-L-fucosidase [Amycolatopsis nigrescens]|uniref:alpha-L-fucosidase n=1 Tax=Amycolatopsis nigrescens TaxID=381445 RepID=UPI0003695CFE|nr:alpha-L-fucosidase [Amycolatopsis nigrescens]